MKKIFRNFSNKRTMVLLASIAFIACSSDEDEDVVIGDDSSDNTDEVVTELHAAFGAFDEDATTIYLDGSNVVIETTGLPNHESVYWGEGDELYRDEPDVDTTPSLMTSNNNATTLTVDATPDLTNNTVTASGTGSNGIAVSGANIFNDQEGNGPLDEAAVSLDWTGGHIGPGVYHYHLEPKAFTDDDANLVGILKDGIFLYGRKCNSTETYPTDLDSSGGHTTATQYTDGVEEYHYHIINELYLNTGSYITFIGPYQGF